MLKLQMRGWCNAVHQPIWTRIAALIRILSNLQNISESVRKTDGKTLSPPIQDDTFLDISRTLTTWQLNRVLTSIIDVIDPCNISEGYNDNYFTL